jgi:hypothetical protein
MFVHRFMAQAFVRAGARLSRDTLLKTRGTSRRCTTQELLCEEVVVLQGTFETLGVSELLGLLAHSRKTGALWLEAGVASAVVYVEDGRCCSALSSDTPDPIEDGPSLRARLVDVCFSIARSEEGAFRFGAEEPPWRCTETVDLEIANDELAHLVDEWRGIQAVIPSLECRLGLTEELSIEELIFDSDRWRLLIGIDGRRNVRDLAHKTNRSVLDVCHALVELVDAGACRVGEAPTTTAAPRSTGGKAARAVINRDIGQGRAAV